MMKPSRARNLLAASAALLLGSHAPPARADILYWSNYRISEVEQAGLSGISPFVSPSAPTGIAFDSAHFFYAASALNTITKYAPNGVGFPFVSGLGTGLSSPYGLAFDAAGNLFVANAGNNTIQMFTPGGVGSVFASTGLNSPRGLAFDRNGNLYAANFGNSTIEKFAPDGTPSLFASTGLSAPYGLAFDAVGNLYAANNTGATIERFTPGGSPSLFATDPQGAPSALTGIAFDSTGNLYAGNLGQTTVDVFTPGGAGSVFTGARVDQPQFLAFTDNAGVPLPLANQAPEPASLGLLGLGACLLAARRRRKA